MKLFLFLSKQNTTIAVCSVAPRKLGSESNGTDLSAIACQILPFALFLSKGNEGFDKLSANGNLLKSVPLGPGRNNSDYNTATNAVILGSDPDSAPNRLLRHHRITESGSDPNITAPGQTRYQLDSCQRFLDKRCRPFFRIARATPWLPQPASCHGPHLCSRWHLSKLPEGFDRLSPNGNHLSQCHWALTPFLRHWSASLVCRRP